MPPVEIKGTEELCFLWFTLLDVLKNRSVCFANIHTQWVTKEDKASFPFLSPHLLLGDI